MKESSAEPNEDTLDDALRELKREGRRYWRRVVFSVAAWIAAFIVVLYSVPGASQGVSQSLGLLTALILLALGVALLPRTQTDSLKKIAELADTRAVGPLLEECFFAGGARYRAIESLLTKLLPQLTPEDAKRLRRSHRVRLREILALQDIRRDADFHIAVLKALERIGDEEDLPSVRRLALGGARSRNESRVRQAARACLPEIEARIERRRVSETLLRPSEAPADSTTLLRPASHSPEAEPNQLLRAAGQEEGS